jgi:hypothetical protein
MTVQEMADVKVQSPVSPSPSISFVYSSAVEHFAGLVFLHRPPSNTLMQLWIFDVVSESTACRVSLVSVAEFV